MTGFDIVVELGKLVAILVAVVGGATLAGFGVWQIGLGIDIGIKKFSKMVRKS